MELRPDRRWVGLACGVLLAALMVVGPAAAQPAELEGEPFGGAAGNLLVSNDSVAFSGLDFELPNGGISGAEIDYLGATYTVVEGSCGGGSPRYQLNTAGKNVFVYFGEAPNFSACGGADTGNLLASADSRCDFTQLGGAFYGNCADVASYTITGIQLVVDGGWQGAQAFEVDPKVVIDLGDPKKKRDCKKGGYVFYGFKNQGQCIKNTK